MLPSRGTSFRIFPGITHNKSTGNIEGSALILNGGDAIGSSSFGGNVYIFGGSTTLSDKGDVILAHNNSTTVGMVGIGTATPEATLDVHGTVQIIKDSASNLLNQHGFSLDEEQIITSTTSDRIIYIFIEPAVGSPDQNSNLSILIDNIINVGYIYKTGYANILLPAGHSLYLKQHDYASGNRITVTSMNFGK